MISRLRRWILRTVAHGDPVVLNAVVDHGMLVMPEDPRFGYVLNLRTREAGVVVSLPALGNGITLSS